MAGIGELFEKVEEAVGLKPAAKPEAGGAPSAKAGVKPSVPKKPGDGGEKPFDIQLYMKAVQLFFSDFFGKKVPYFFQNMGPVLKAAPAWWQKLPQDEQIGYGVLVLGFLMVIVGIVLWIVL